MPLQFTYMCKGQFGFWWNKTKQMELSLIEWYSPLNLPLGLVKKFVLETVSWRRGGQSPCGMLWSMLRICKVLFRLLTFPQNNISMTFWCFMLLHLASLYNVAFNPMAKNVILDSKDFLSLPVSFYD